MIKFVIVIQFSLSYYRKAQTPSRNVGLPSCSTLVFEIVIPNPVLLIIAFLISLFMKVSQLAPIYFCLFGAAEAAEVFRSVLKKR